MIKVTHIEVFNVKNAIIGMRNPMNSWDKSDSFNDETGGNGIGPADLELMHKLLSAGPPHYKFMRQILCSMQIEAPLYWWKEMDTYKVATVADSCSTMHKIHSKPIELTDFSFDNTIPFEPINGIDIDTIRQVNIDMLESLRLAYLQTKDKYKVDNPYWRALIQQLPESYNQARMWSANYATLREIYKWRRHHKLSEWREFCAMLEEMPYGKDLIAYELN